MPNSSISFGCGLMSVEKNLNASRLSSLVNGATSTAGEFLVKLNERSCQIFYQIKREIISSHKSTSTPVKSSVKFN